MLAEAIMLISFLTMSEYGDLDHRIMWRARQNSNNLTTPLALKIYKWWKTDHFFLYFT